MLNRIMAAVALVLLVGACARGGRPSADAAIQAAPDSVLVHVRNENYFAARIHAQWLGGQRRSLGTVDGNGGRAKVTIPWEPRALVFEILLITDGGAWVSESVNAGPADSIELRLPQNFGASAFFRRVRP